MRKENTKFNCKHDQTVKKFHQFVKIERGPINSAVIDLLRGHVFQVPNEAIARFNAGELEDMQDFVKVLQEEKMILDIEPFRWIPEIDLGFDEDIKSDKDQNIELHIDEGVNLTKILTHFEEYPIFKVIYYGTKCPANFQIGLRFEKREKNFDDCIAQATINGSFCKIQESMIRFNKRFNSCWGGTIAITADGKIRPCIHSLVEIGNIEHDLDDIDSLIDKLEPFWEYNKDKVERCCICEFRYVCFDCREIAMRKNGDIGSPNPLCGYNPNSGKWED